MVRALLVALGVFWSVSTGAAPLEAYGQLPSISGVQISPDGKMVAYLWNEADQRQMVVSEIGTGKALGGVALGDYKIRGIRWAGPNFVLIESSITNKVGDRSIDHEFGMAEVFDVRTRRQTPLMRGVHDVLSTNNFGGAAAVRTLGGHTLVFAPIYTYQDTRSRLSLVRIDLSINAVSEMAEHGDAFTTNYLVDAAGRAVAQTQYDSEKSQWALLINPGGGWKSVDRREFKLEPPHIEGLSKDGLGVLVRFRQDDGDILREMRPDGAYGPDIKAPDEIIVDPLTRKWIGSVVLMGDSEAVTFFDPADQNAWKMVQKAFPGASLRLESWTDDRKAMIVRVDQDGFAPAYAYINLTTHHAEWIGQEYGKLTPDDIGHRESISFKAADGLEIPGYLTLPHGREAKALPLVVLPHGGPAARDYPQFDWWAQAVASRGYAVLQVNYRGSDGYGWGFQSAGFGEWGRKMQSDLSDGVRYLVGRGLVDPKRVCIFGGSYGGYAALAGATLDPAPYRCAISLAGPSDMRAMVGYSEDREGQFGKRYWLRYMGPKEGLDEISPAKHADRSNIPVLLIHGKDDTVVPFEQSLIMQGALQAAGRHVELVTLASEDHWLSRGATRLQMLQSAMDFLARYNPP
jgi:dipeptidyl aminopeptidase/acylaminoacyl peptidase